jgi:hypothetical protein
MQLGFVDATQGPFWSTRTSTLATAYPRSSEVAQGLYAFGCAADGDHPDAMDYYPVDSEAALMCAFRGIVSTDFSAS